MSRLAVIGGGLAGAGVATLLARQGREVVLFEREPGPHDKVCGAFLSGDAVDSLRRMGLDAAALGARPIGQVAIFAGARRVHANLPFRAFGLSRRVLDEALAARAQAAGADLRRGARVAGLRREPGGWAIDHASGQTLFADQVFLATGKHDLRGWGRPPQRRSDMVGFKTALTLSAPVADAIAGFVELHLFPGGYAGVDLVEDGRANLCLVVRKAVFARAGGDWPSLLAHLRAACPALVERLAALGAEKPLAIAAIPYGYVRKEGEPGLWRLGDQAAVVPSLVGDGMAMALHSAELAAAFVAAGRDACAFQPAFARAVRRPMRLAGLVSGLALNPATHGLAAHALAAAPRLAALAAAQTRTPPPARL